VVVIASRGAGGNVFMLRLGKKGRLGWGGQRWEETTSWGRVAGSGY